MVSEVLKPLVMELPANEKRRLLEWLQQEVEGRPTTDNTKLRNRLIKHIEKSKVRNQLKKK